MARRGPNAIVAWLRVPDDPAGTAGAAFLVGPETALTCAHVVREHLGLGRPTPRERPTGTLTLRLHGLKGLEVEAEVAEGGWFPDEPGGEVEDVAVLRLRRPVDGLRYAGLALASPRPKERCYVYGAVGGYAASGAEPGGEAAAELALHDLAGGDPAQAMAVLAEIEAESLRLAAGKDAEAAAHRRAAAEAARSVGALAYLRSTAEALAAYRRAAELDSGDTWTWIFLARLERQAGSLAAAERAAERARGAARAAGDERGLMAALGTLGDIRVAHGDLAEAERAFRAAHDVAAKLAAADPGNAGRRHDLSVSLERVGDVRVVQGDLAGALQAYKEVQEILSGLAAADPGHTGWWRDLSVGLNKVGDVRLAQGDLAGALRAYEEGLGIRRGLAAADPGNAGWRRDLVVSHWKLAAAEAAPARHYREALGIARGMAAAGTLALVDGWTVGELERLLAAAEAGGAGAGGGPGG